MLNFDGADGRKKKGKEAKRPLLGEMLAFDPKTNILSLESDKQHGWDAETFLPSLEIDQNEKYYLLYVEYTTGDSFNPKRQTEYEVIDMYRTDDKETVVETANKIKSHADGRRGSSKKPEPLEIKLANGETYTLNHVPWEGGMESLQEVVAVPVGLTIHHTMRF